MLGAAQKIAEIRLLHFIAEKPVSALCWTNSAMYTVTKCLSCSYTARHAMNMTLYIVNIKTKITYIKPTSLILFINFTAGEKSLIQLGLPVFSSTM